MLKINIISCLILVILDVVLGILNVVDRVWSYGIVIGGAVKVITTIRPSRVPLDQLLSDAQHCREENAVRFHPVHVLVPVHGGTEERSEVIVSINDT